MKYRTQFFLLVFCLLGSTVEIRASMQEDQVMVSSKISALDWPGETAEPQKPGLFKQFRAIKKLKKQMQMLALEDEPPSKLARAAILVFAVSLGLMAFSRFLPAISIISLAGLLASNIMAMIVIYRKDNLRSRKLARAIIVASLVLVIIALLSALFLLIFLVTLFG